MATRWPGWRRVIRPGRAGRPGRPPDARSPSPCRSTARSMSLAPRQRFEDSAGDRRHAERHGAWGRGPGHDVRRLHVRGGDLRHLQPRLPDVRTGQPGVWHRTHDRAAALRSHLPGADLDGSFTCDATGTRAPKPTTQRTRLARWSRPRGGERALAARRRRDRIDPGLRAHGRHASRARHAAGGWRRREPDPRAVPDGPGGATPPTASPSCVPPARTATGSPDRCRVTPWRRRRRPTW